MDIPFNTRRQQQHRQFQICYVNGKRRKRKKAGLPDGGPSFITGCQSQFEVKVLTIFVIILRPVNAVPVDLISDR
jgi:hypothetical protein